MDDLLDLSQTELPPPLVKFLPGDNTPDRANNTFRVSVTNLRGTAMIQVISYFVYLIHHYLDENCRWTLGRSSRH